MDKWMIIMMAALALSEALALIPAVKSNSIFTMIFNVLKKVVKKK